jgi:hypothetical protein
LPQFAAGVVDTGGKFAADVVDTGGKPVSLTLVANFHQCRYKWCTLTCEYLGFSKKIETILMGYSAAGGKLIHKKTRSKKSLDTVPFI